MTGAERRARREGVDPADIPYGPGNPDYEHDAKQDPHPEDLRLKQYFEFAQSLFDSSH